MIPDKRSLRNTIHECGGAIADIARHYEVSRQTVYRWLDKKNLRDEVTNARANMREVAKDITYQRLFDEDPDRSWDAAKFVLLHMGEDGEVISLSPQIAAMLRRMGLSAQQIMSELEELLPELLSARAS